MNLPPPFHKASDVKADAHGSISLFDYMGKALARIPLTTAFELSTGSKGLGSGDGFGDGSGTGYGVGYGGTDVDGSGRGKDK